MSQALCCISYRIITSDIQVPQSIFDQKQQSKRPCLAPDLKMIPVYSGMTTYEIAAQIGNELGIGYQLCIENEVIRQIQAIIGQGNSHQPFYQQSKQTEILIDKNAEWRKQMQDILFSSAIVQAEVLQPQIESKYQHGSSKNNDIEHENSNHHEHNYKLLVQRSSLQKLEINELDNTQLSYKYFKNSYEQVLRNKSQKSIHYKGQYKGYRGNNNNDISSNNNQNMDNIYERSLAKMKQVANKMARMKKNMQIDEFAQCTFSPNIASTFDFLNREGIHNNNKYVQKEKKHDRLNFSHASTFERLYMQSFDLQQKKKQRLRTLQIEQEAKISSLSFTPQINKCSRQICQIKNKMKDSQESEGNFCIEQQNLKKSRQRGDTAIEHKVLVKKKEKKTACTFQPQISQSTRKLTKNLPSFYQRLQQKKQKTINSKCLNNDSRKNITNLQSLKSGLKNKILKIGETKKQIYTIEEQGYIYKFEQGCQFQQEEIQTQKKAKKSIWHHNLQDSSNPCLFFSLNSSNQQIELNLRKTQNLGSLQMFKEKCKLKQIQIGQKRSAQLFNIRKKIIFKSAANYFSLRPFSSTVQFCKLKVPLNASNLEISSDNIEKNPYLPKSVKVILAPVTQQLKQVGVQLSKQQFIQALETLFESLNFNQRGILLAWGVKLLPEEQKDSAYQLNNQKRHRD